MTDEYSGWDLPETLREKLGPMNAEQRKAVFAKLGDLLAEGEKEDKPFTGSIPRGRRLGVDMAGGLKRVFFRGRAGGTLSDCQRLGGV